MPALQVDPALIVFHAAFPGTPGEANWRLRSDGLLIEGEAGPIGSGGKPITVTRVWTTWKNEISLTAAEFGVPIEVIIATICAESSGDPNARREEPNYQSDEATPGQVSVGLTQTLISTARSMSGSLGVAPSAIDDPWLRVPLNSIRAGTAYMRSQQGQTHYDPPKAACAYNAGSLRRDTSAGNRWKMVQYPIGTSAHADRWVKWFNDCFAAFATPAALPDPSYVKALVGVS
jgi:hypothetical protein